MLQILKKLLPLSEGDYLGKKAPKNTPRYTIKKHKLAPSQASLIESLFPPDERALFDSFVLKFKIDKQDVTVPLIKLKGDPKDSSVTYSSFLFPGLNSNGIITWYPTLKEFKKEAFNVGKKCNVYLIDSGPEWLNNPGFSKHNMEDDIRIIEDILAFSKLKWKINDSSTSLLSFSYSALLLPFAKHPFKNNFLVAPYMTPKLSLSNLWYNFPLIWNNPVESLKSTLIGFPWIKSKIQEGFSGKTGLTKFFQKNTNDPSLLTKDLSCSSKGDSKTETKSKPKSSVSISDEIFRVHSKKNMHPFDWIYYGRSGYNHKSYFRFLNNILFRDPFDMAMLTPTNLASHGLHLNKDTAHHFILPLSDKGSKNKIIENCFTRQDLKNCVFSYEKGGHVLPYNCPKEISNLLLDSFK
ncbi:hypothetical protein ACFLZV_02840 [Candidatus Margulisiibacteriota bacterium]